MSIRPGGVLVPAAERVQHTLVPGNLWRVRLEDGSSGWWKRAVTPPWRLAFAVHSHSRAQREYAALRLLRQRGLAAPEPMAWEIRRRGPFLAESALVTRETPDLARLDHFLREEADPLRRSAALRAAAEMTARMHARGIGHFRLLPKNMHIERAHPQRAWLLDAAYACAWGEMVPRHVRIFDLCCLCGPASGVNRQDSETLIEAYELASGTVTERPRLICSRPFATKARRILFYLGALWTGHRPENYLSPADSR